ncbi:hypothetical protein J4733_10220 [Klebsiella pneumoniae]|uniref:Uncharacterized protein n=1 Tax=Klebsiella pneumoniae TaxID=573 RepID=A0A939SU09_KLEPN|nr:hypothetical protein [Klebsiella pneumoniae]
MTRWPGIVLIHSTNETLFYLNGVSIVNHCLQNSQSTASSAAGFTFFDHNLGQPFIRWPKGGPLFGHA